MIALAFLSLLMLTIMTMYDASVEAAKSEKVKRASQRFSRKIRSASNEFISARLSANRDNLVAASGLKRRRSSDFDGELDLGKQAQLVVPPGPPSGAVIV
jgi:hypothetical protein